MLIKAKKSITTIKPEKFWQAGEILNVPEEIGKQLLTNPNFEPVLPNSSKSGRKNK